MAKQDRVGDFLQQAEQAQTGLLRELWAWLRHNKKWWLLPIVVVLLFVSFLVFLSGTALAPFIYTLF
jgi:drug/metabolite transporter superfamily protein YnfA